MYKVHHCDCVQFVTHAERGRGGGGGCCSCFFLSTIFWWRTQIFVVLIITATASKLEYSICKSTGTLEGEHCSSVTPQLLHGQTGTEWVLGWNSPMAIPWLTPYLIEDRLVDSEAYMPNSHYETPGMKTHLVFNKCSVWETMPATSCTWLLYHCKKSISKGAIGYILVAAWHLSPTC